MTVRPRRRSRLDAPYITTSLLTRQLTQPVRLVSDRLLRRWLLNGSKGIVQAMKKVALSEVKDDLSRYLRMAEKQELVITRHGKPAGVLVGFASEKDWFDYRLENDPRFLQRIERARQSLRHGKGVRLENVATTKRGRAGRRAVRVSRGRMTPALRAKNTIPSY